MLLDVQRALACASESFRKPELARQMQSPPAAKVAHASAKPSLEGTPRGPTTDSGALSAARRAGGELVPPVGAAAKELRSGAVGRPAAMSRLGAAHVAVEMAERKPTGRRLSMSFAQPYAGAGRHEAGEDAVR